MAARYHKQKFSWKKREISRDAVTFPVFHIQVVTSSWATHVCSSSAQQCGNDLSPWAKIGRVSELNKKRRSVVVV